MKSIVTRLFVLFVLVLSVLAMVVAPFDEALAGKRIVSMTTESGAIHTDSTTETSIATYAFRANELLPGKVYEFEAVCRAFDNNSTDTLLIAVRFGTSATVTSNTAIASSTAVDSEDNDMVVVRGRIMVQTAVRYVFTVQMNDPDAEGTAVEAYHKIFTGVASTAYNLDITADWSVAHADNEVQCEAFTVYELT